MIRTLLSIDRLIAVVREGGTVKTGVDVYDREGVLLLAGDVLVDQVQTLEVISRSGVRRIPLARDGGVFDRSGQELRDSLPDNLADVPADVPVSDPDQEPGARDFLPEPQNTPDVETRLREIQEIRQEAALVVSRARDCLKKVLDQVRSEKGQFDLDAVRTQVGDMKSFTREAGHPALYLARDLFSFDTYLWDHAVNVCAMGTAVARRFNSGFSNAVETALWPQPSSEGLPGAFAYYLPQDLDDISLGLFLFDIGKALVPENLLNKSSALNSREFALVKRHSYEFGLRILEANRLSHPVLSNMVQYHHAPIYDGEKGGYPRSRPAAEIPIYVKICKLVDIYDAMVSRTSYRDARNQTAAATELFRTYVKRDTMLQFLLHAFVGCIGLYPPGSIVYLKNGQMAYVLDEKGPIVLPFTDTRGETLDISPDPFDTRSRSEIFQVDADRSVRNPIEVFRYCCRITLKPLPRQYHENSTATAIFSGLP